MRLVFSVSSVLSVVTTSLLVAACGNESMSETRSQVGRFVDSPVFGLRVSSGARLDTTDKFGEFYYSPGSTYIFSVGNYVLGRAALFDRNVTVTPGMLADQFPVAQRKAAMIGLTQFLMTADNDRNPDNGIRIISSLSDSARNWSNIPLSFVLDLTSANATQVLNDMRVANAIPGLNWVTVPQAKMHLDKTMGCAYSGVFLGTLDNGHRLAMVVNGGGSVEGREYAPSDNKVYQYNSSFLFSDLEADTALNRKIVSEKDGAPSELRYSQDIRYPDYIGVSVRAHSGVSFPSQDRPLSRLGKMTSAIVSYSGHVQTPYPFGRDYAFMVNTYEKNDARGVIVNLQSGSVAELVGGYSVAGLNLATTMDGRAITLSGTPGGGTNPVWSMAFTEKFNDVTQTVSATGFAGCRAGV